jgi:predicted MarR family transcription regulator
MNENESTWHLAKTDVEANLTEFEFLFWRMYYSFVRWQEDCQCCVSDDDISADEIALVHLIRMHDRGKTISEISRLLNRDDFSNIQYSLKKLLKLKLIQKSNKTTKKSISYEITEYGKKITNQYGNVRRKILLKMFDNTQKEDWHKLHELLTNCKNTYDEAARVAALNIGEGEN